MKVLHVIPAVAKRYGGPSQAVYKMCQTLQIAGHEPVICTTNADGLSELPVNLNRIEPFQSVPTIFFSRQISEAYKYSSPLAQWLSNNVSRFDVVHVHAIFSHSSLAAANASQKLDVPYVVRPLGSLSKSSLNQKRLRKNIFWHLGVKRMLHKASAIQYASGEEKRIAESYLRLKGGVVIPLAVDQSFADLDAGSPSPGASYSTAPYVLVLSRLHPIKGLETFLTAFGSLVRNSEFNKWRLIIAGDGEPRYVGTLKTLVQQEQLGEHVVFRGWVDGTEKLALLKNASMLALPSLHENFGLSIIESLAWGVPVLVSPYVNLAEEIQAAGAGWVTPLDSDSIEHILGDALRDERERAKRGEAGKQLVDQRFTWPTVGGQLTALYDSLNHKDNGRL